MTINGRLENTSGEWIFPEATDLRVMMYALENIRYDYLRIVNTPETGSKTDIFTNDLELTFEQLKIAQIESNMESIDSYQLFSYSE